MIVTGAGVDACVDDDLDVDDDFDWEVPDDLGLPVLYPALCAAPLEKPLLLAEWVINLIRF